MKSTKVTAGRPSGFPEMLPREQVVFKQMLQTVCEVFELCGFLPIETPAVERKNVLLAKGGGETEKQVYQLANINGELSDMCLHFDLTVPLARYVVEHLNDLTLPFRRYQAQKVWRGERAQKGRYREFYQCDIDVIGTTNPLTDAEIPSVIYQVFKRLQIPKFTIGVSNRKLICGIYETLVSKESLNEFLVIADNLPKRGIDDFYAQMTKLGIMPSDAKFLLKVLEFRGSYNDLQSAFPRLADISLLVEEGLSALKVVYDGVLTFGVPPEYAIIDLGIVRGLDYYTGTVYETILDDYPEVGSICSGGRYDNLCQYYTNQKLPGVGISIGLDRLFGLLKEKGLLPPMVTYVSDVLVIAADDAAQTKALEIANQIRSVGVNCEVYLEKAKIGKQFRYAESLGIPFVIVVDETGSETDTSTLVRVDSGDRQNVSLADALQIIQHNREIQKFGTPQE